MKTESDTRSNGVVRSGRLLALLACFCFSVSVWAQGNNAALDTSAPVIELETLDSVLADQSQVFTAQIAEETALRDAIFYYRRSGQSAFTSTPMKAIGSSGFYSATVRTDPTDLRPIEYYIQARDTSGNRTVSGFAFDPYVRQIAQPVSVAIDEQPATTPTAQPEPEQPLDATTEPFYKKRWVQIAVGVVAVGVIAGSLGGDDGTETLVAPVTFSLE